MALLGYQFTPRVQTSCWPPVMPPVVAVATSGTDYMRLRQAALEQTDALLSELSRRARASVVARDQAATYLVPR